MPTALFLAHADSQRRAQLLVGTLADAADDRGFDVCVHHPPGSFSDLDAVEFIVVLGSSESAYDDSVGWLSAERALLRGALNAGTPIFGICFGAQLLSRALGGVVDRAPRPEIGLMTVEPVLNPGAVEGLIMPGPWMQWHFDRFTVPPGGTLAARNSSGSQAFVHGRHLGVQFHPEISPQCFSTWRQTMTAEAEQKLLLEHRVDVELLSEQIAAEAPRLADRSVKLFDRFLSLP
jgi:GMP synthase (glutamine-hydrolysing)